MDLKICVSMDFFLFNQFVFLYIYEGAFIPIYFKYRFICERSSSDKNVSIVYTY